MRLTIQVIAFLVMSFVLLGTIALGQAKEGSITGRVSLTNPNGDVIYGDWVRVFLTAAPIDIPEVTLSGIKTPLERRSRINSGHMDFFVSFRRKQDEPGYLVDNKLTRPDGTFAFYQIPIGRYYVLITFPTMIAGFKCAWQAPVEVVEGQTVHVELDNRNLAVPAF